MAEQKEPPRPHGDPLQDELTGTDHGDRHDGRADPDAQDARGGNEATRDTEGSGEAGDAARPAADRVSRVE